MVRSTLGSISAIAREMTRLAKRPFGERAITATQMQTLFLLAHAPGPITAGELAKRLGVTAGAVTQLVDGLREQHLAERIVKPGDARSKFVALTESARRAVDEFEAAIDAQFRDRFAALPDDTLQIVSTSLRALEASS